MNVEETLIRDRETARDSDTLDMDKRAEQDRRIAELESVIQDAREETRTRDEQFKNLSAVLSQRDEQTRIRSVRIRAALTKGSRRRDSHGINRRRPRNRMACIGRDTPFDCFSQYVHRLDR